MKKFLLASLFILSALGVKAAPITCDAYISPDDVTIANLESMRSTLVDAINNLDGSALNDASVSADALVDNANPVVRWNEAFNDFVFTGLLPPTATGLSSTTTAGTAYISGERVVKDATAHTYTASKHTFVDLSYTGTYTYSEVAIGASEPTVSDGNLRLARVSTDATDVLAVRDDRVTTLSLGTSERYDRNGLEISVTTPDAIVIGPGFCFHGSTEISKLSNTSLALGTAADYAGGLSQRAVSTYGFVVVDDSGNIKLTTTAPTKSDTAGGTTGKLRYSVINSDYYRVLGWFYMNSTGSGNIDEWGYSNFKDGDAPNIISWEAKTNIITGSTSYTAMTEDAQAIHFYSAGGYVSQFFNCALDRDGGAAYVSVALSGDGGIIAQGQVDISTQNQDVSVGLAATEKTTQGEKTINPHWKVNAGNAIQHGSTWPRVMIVEER